MICCGHHRCCDYCPCCGRYLRGWYPPYPPWYAPPYPWYGPPVVIKPCPPPVIYPVACEPPSFSISSALAQARDAVAA